MTRNLALSFLIFLTAAVCQGQDLTPFAGTWTLDKEATFAKQAGRSAYNRYDLELVPDGEKLVVKKNVDFRGTITNSESTLYLDGRGETNLVELQRGERREVRSKTKIKDDSIVREYTVGREEPPLGLNRLDRITEKFSLSKDGKHLIYVRRQVSEIGPGDLKVKTMGNLHTKMTLIFRRV